MNFIEQLIPQKRSHRTRRIWTAVFVLAPLAYGIGIWMNSRLMRSTDLVLEVGRSEAIQTARNYAESLGWDVSGRAAFSSVKPNDTLYIYYRSIDDDFAARLRDLQPISTIQVIFLEQGREAFLAHLKPDGAPIGYSARVPQAGVAEFGGVEIESTHDDESSVAPAKDETPIEEARQTAEVRFRQRTEAIGFLNFDDQPLVETDRSGDRVIRNLTWKGRAEEHPEATVKLLIQVEGDRVVAENFTVDLDPLYVARELETQSVAKTVMWVIFVISAIFFSIYGFILYIRRALQKEVSHTRSIGVGLVIGLSLVLLALSSAVEQLAIQFKRAPEDPFFIAALVATALGYLMVGMWIGMFWGCSEGEVRESYGEKLVSLDALIVGRFFSRDVARAAVVGALLGGWLLLATALVQFPWSGRPEFGLSVTKHIFLIYSRFPGLVSLLHPLINALPVVAVGLLMPLTFSLRRFRSARVRQLALLLLAFVGCSWIGLNLSPFVSGMLVSVVMVAFLLISFRAYDLLVSVVTLSAYSFTNGLVVLLAVTSFGDFTAAVETLCAVIIMGVLAYFAAQGREVREEDVRPLYAENLAQRLSLQAELSAAREAQLRLTPQQVPQIEGFSLAACCRPGRVVGGDFYDFFPIDDGKIGLFLAEGGGSGLSSALTIAYAKGLILPMLARQPSPPLVMERLLYCMRDLVEARQEQFGFLFGILENESGRFEYALHGEFPRLLRFSADGSHPPEGESWPQTDHGGFQSGQMLLRFPAGLILVTNGILDILRINQASPEEWFGGLFGQYPEATAPQLQDAFLQALDPLVRQARRRGVEDDISAIILRAEKREAEERVA